MNDPFVQLKELMGDKTRAQLFWAEVKEVDWDNREMTATGLIDGLDYYNVKLGMGARAVKPQQGSRVLLAVIDGQAMQNILIYADEAEALHTQTGNLEISIDQDKVKVDNGTQNLKNLLDQLIERLKTAVIQTPAGPGNFSPADVTALEQIKQGINQILY